MSKMADARNFVLNQVKRSFLRYTNILQAGSSTDQEVLKQTIRGIEALSTKVLNSALLFSSQKERLSTHIHKLLEEAKKFHEEKLGQGISYQVPTKQTGRRGKPEYAISKNQLEHLIKNGFSRKEIANTLNVSVDTVRNRLRAYGLKIRHFSDINNIELDRAVLQCMQGGSGVLNHSAGPNMILASLKGHGINVPRSRVRLSMRRVDSIGCEMRSVGNPVYRRTYAVAGPNSMWHIDGNHKLIRWGIIIHGAIDGATRMLTFLKAADNNRSNTVLQHFTEAVSKFGMPSRIRVDEGVENNGVCLLMEAVRGFRRGSAIRGKSVHNQRIERQWRDMFIHVSVNYHALFTSLEEKYLLEPSNRIDMWCLHFIFLSPINNDLQKYKIMWNNHKIRTAGNATPRKLFLKGLLLNRNSQLTAVEEIFRNGGTHECVIPDILRRDLHDSLNVCVPQFTCPLDNDQLTSLQNHLRNLPLTKTVHQYIACRKFVMEILG